MSVESKKMRLFSWLSQASYRDLSSLDVGDIAGFKAKLSDPSPALLGQDKVFALGQADELSSAVKLSYVTQLPNTSNGTSLTIFKSKEETNSSYTIAVRGTEPTGPTLGVGVDINLKPSADAALKSTMTR